MTEELSGINEIPVLALRDVVVYPQMVIPLFVGRPKSIAALQHAMDHDKKIFLVAQKNAKDDEPNHQDLYQVGTLATVIFGWVPRRGRTS